MTILEQPGLATRLLLPRKKRSWFRAHGLLLPARSDYEPGVSAEPSARNRLARKITLPPGNEPRARARASRNGSLHAERR